MNLLPTKSAIQHSRFAFSIFLLPVFVFALSQVSEPDFTNTTLAFIVWHLCIYPASNGYNSYFDKDEGSIALLENPPTVDKSLYRFSLFLDLIGVALALMVSLEFAIAVFSYGLISKLYSHPSVRLKKYPVISFLIVFLFQGAFVYWTSYAAISGELLKDNWSTLFLVGGLICSCLIGASYPLTQVYQHEEDRKRGDRTLSILLGIRGSFLFAAGLFITATLLMFAFWKAQNQLNNFWIFLIFILPVLVVFINWTAKALKDPSQANFKNMSKMTWLSGIMMLMYFTLILVI